MKVDQDQKQNHDTLQDELSKLETIVPSLTKVAPVLEELAPKLEKVLQHLPEAIDFMESRIKSLETRIDLLTKLNDTTQRDINGLKTSIIELIEAVKVKL